VDEAETHKFGGSTIKLADMAETVIAPSAS